MLRLGDGWDGPWGTIHPFDKYLVGVCLVDAWLCGPGAVDRDRCELEVLEPRGEMAFHGITRQTRPPWGRGTAC